MFNSMNVLQLGHFNLKTEYSIPDEMNWVYEPDWDDSETIAELKSIRQFDVAIVDRAISKAESERLIECVRAYGLFVFDDAKFDINHLMESRAGKRISRENFQDFIDSRLIHYYSDTYGEQFSMFRFTVCNQKGYKIRYTGFDGTEVKGDFGEYFRQFGYWCMNVPLQPEMSLDLWLEYEKSIDVQLEMDVYVCDSAAEGNTMEEYHFSNSELESKEYLSIYNSKEHVGYVFVSLKAKGEGMIKVRKLHDRWGRGKEGVFLPGGERTITSDREEAFFYFEPGDLKPPLNVYFSGYKTREGFEGYGIMRAMKSPFLLVADQRLEGGNFYIGSKEYEKLVKNKILDVMEKLHFTEKDLVFSGISMGTTGAMYYGSMIGPEYIILGKPLADLGTIAENERINRPGGFPTSLDMLAKEMGDLSEESVKKMNERFWKNFSLGNWGHTTFIISYMYEDDYDGCAYQTLLSNLRNSGTRVFGKGLHGRHNDDTGGIIQWFYKQYKLVLRDHYGRNLESTD